MAVAITIRAHYLCVLLVLHTLFDVKTEEFLFLCRHDKIIIFIFIYMYYEKYKQGMYNEYAATMDKRNMQPL